MGNSTGSMFYMFAAFIAIYIVGMLCYEAYRFFKKWRERRADEKIRDDGK
ncbi:MAG: hypothetical protein LUE86_12955 [Clostridiales bacterium]|nr:hypothetical protein [Clostridiales bacterium]